MKTFKTDKGTELPLLNLKGKDYLQVAHRIVWFRENHPKWSIETEFIEMTENVSMAKATIKDELGRIMATAHKRETKQGFADHTEKSETGSIGRALALIGYGTQFTEDFDEGVRLADSPLPRPVSQSKPQFNTPPTTKKAPLAASVGHISEAQLARLFAIASKNKWPKTEIDEWVGKLGLSSSKDLNQLQYQKLCETIIAYPK